MTAETLTTTVCTHHGKTDLEALVMLKARLLADGVRLSPAITEKDVHRPQYSVVTEGVELDLFNGITANARINQDSGIVLRRIEKHAELSVDKERFPAKILPTPSFLFNKVPGTHQSISDYCFIATDRINIWVVESCAMAVQATPCRFCDVAFENVPYRLQDKKNIQWAMNALRADGTLTARHIQISGGTPLHADWGHFIDVCVMALETGLPVSVMTSPATPWDVLDQLRQLGVAELALNVEFNSDEMRKKLTPGKMGAGWDRLAKIAQHWPEKSVRSALIVGPEPESETIRGVSRLLERGIIPMLSPFRPAAGTPMVTAMSPSSDLLYRVFMRAMEEASKYGSYVGPSCRHCQHNVMALPLDVC